MAGSMNASAVLESLLCIKRAGARRDPDVFFAGRRALAGGVGRLFAKQQ